MNLKDLKVKTKATWADFPGLEGFKVELCYITREVSTKLQEESTVTTFDKKTRAPVSELDTDLFIEKFAKAAIKDWKGLKYSYLPSLILVDLSEVEDVEAELEFNQENVVEILKGSQHFDTWVNDIIFDLDRFRD